MSAGGTADSYENLSTPSPMREDGTEEEAGRLAREALAAAEPQGRSPEGRGTGSGKGPKGQGKEATGLGGRGSLSSRKGSEKGSQGSTGEETGGRASRDPRKGAEKGEASRRRQEEEVGDRSSRRQSEETRTAEAAEEPRTAEAVEEPQAEAWEGSGTWQRTAGTRNEGGRWWSEAWEETPQDHWREAAEDPLVRSDPWASFQWPNQRNRGSPASYQANHSQTPQTPPQRPRNTTPQYTPPRNSPPGSHRREEDEVSLDSWGRLRSKQGSVKEVPDWLIGTPEPRAEPATVAEDVSTLLQTVLAVFLQKEVTKRPTRMQSSWRNSQRSWQE